MVAEQAKNLSKLEKKDSVDLGQLEEKLENLKQQQAEEFYVKESIIQDYSWIKKYKRVEQFEIGPDGTGVAVIAKAEHQYAVVVNDQSWKNTYAKIDELKIGKNGTVAALVQKDSELDQENGSLMVVVDDTEWSEFQNATDLKLGDDGKVAARVQDENDNWRIAVDRVTWLRCINVQAPEMGADGTVAALVEDEDDGLIKIAINGKRGKNFELQEGYKLKSITDLKISTVNTVAAIVNIYHKNRSHDNSSDKSYIIVNEKFWSDYAEVKTPQMGIDGTVAAVVQEING